MGTSDTGAFRRRQAIADLVRQRAAISHATARGIVSGFPDLASPNLQRRLEWYFAGKAPIAELQRDRRVHGVLLMASALPEEDFERFMAATVLLLLERLCVDGGQDDGFWNWQRLAPRYRLAPPSLRAAIMCGFREARRLGRIAFADGPSAEDCLTVTRTDLLASLAERKVAQPLLAGIESAIMNEADARQAGALWAALHKGIAKLPDPARQAVEDGFRYLYERSASIEPPSVPDLPVIPGHA